MMPSRNKKILIGLGAAFLLFWIGLLVYSRLNQTVLEVQTSSDSMVYVSAEKGGLFREVGRGNSRYVADGPGTVFVQVVNGDQKSILSVELTKSETTKVSVETRPTLGANRVANRALSYIHVEGKFLFGVNPVSRSVSYADTTGQGRSYQFPFFTLPFLSKIYWYDSNNFVYYSGKVGAVIKGRDTELGYKTPNGEQGVFIDVSKHAEKPIVVISRDGIFLENKKRAFMFSKIADIDSVRSPRLFSDANYIYLIDHYFVQRGAGDEGSVPVITGTTLNVYDYEGNQVSVFELDMKENVNNIVDDFQSDHYVLLGESSTVQVSKSSGELSQTPYYFGGASDIALSEELGLVMLTIDGFWSYDKSSGLYNLISPFPENEEYVAGSLTLFKDRVLYSTQISRDALSNKDGAAGSSVYQIDL